MKDAGGSALAHAAVLAALTFIAAIAFGWPPSPQKSQALIQALDEPSAMRSAQGDIALTTDQDTTGSAAIARVRLGDSEERGLRPIKESCADVR